ncbi:MAG: hypothetical protein ACSHYB_16270 [Roseibacillus sp.]
MDPYIPPGIEAIEARLSWLRYSNRIAAVALILMITIPVFRFGFEINFTQVASKVLAFAMALLVYQFPRRAGIWVAALVLFSLVGNHFVTLELVRSFNESTGSPVRLSYWIGYLAGCLPAVVAIVFSILSRWFLHHKNVA